jgi:hypothetical protein
MCSNVLSPAFRRPTRYFKALSARPKGPPEGGTQSACQPEGHAIRSLKKSNTHLALRDIPADKLEKLGEMLAILNENGGQANE